MVDDRSIETSARRVLGLMEYNNRWAQLEEAMPSMRNLFPQIPAEHPKHQRARLEAATAIAIHNIIESEDPSQLVNDPNILRSIRLELNRMNSDVKSARRLAEVVNKTADAKMQPIPLPEARKKVNALLDVKTPKGDTLRQQIHSLLDRSPQEFPDLPGESETERAARKDRVIDAAIDHAHRLRGTDYFTDSEHKLDIPVLMDMALKGVYNSAPGQTWEEFVSNRGSAAALTPTGSRVP